jgi:hypothetical protein
MAQQLGGIQQFVQAAHRDDAQPGEHRVIGGRGARQRAGMRQGKGPGGFAAAQLQRDDRDAACPRQLGRGDEGGRVADGLQDAGDHPDGGLVQEVADIVGQAGRQLLPRRDGVVEAHLPAVADQPRPAGTGVRDQRHARGRGQVAKRHRGHLQALAQVQETHAVGAADRHAGLARDGGDGLGARRAAGGGAMGAAEQHRGADAGLGGGGDGLDDLGIPQGEGGAIDAAGNGGQVGQAGRLVDAVVARVHQMDRAGIAQRADRRRQAGAKAAGAGAGAHHRDRARRQQRIKWRGHCPASFSAAASPDKKRRVTTSPS